MIFFIIPGLLFSVLAVLLLGFYIRIIRKESVIGEICGIDDNGSSHAPGAAVFHIEVSFHKDGTDKKMVALNRFIAVPFFEKFQLSQVRKKHIGKQVHIYYNPDNTAQVLLREYMWKEILLCAFLFCLGTILIIAGFYKWY